MKNHFIMAATEARETKTMLYYNHSYGNFFTSNKEILNPCLELVKNFSTQ
jgi:hypothetical protein